MTYFFWSFVIFFARVIVITGDYLKEKVKNSAWDGREEPLLVAGAFIAFVLLIIFF